MIDTITTNTSYSHESKHLTYAKKWTRPWRHHGALLASLPCYCHWHEPHKERESKT